MTSNIKFVLTFSLHYPYHLSSCLLPTCHTGQYFRWFYGGSEFCCTLTLCCIPLPSGYSITSKIHFMNPAWFIPVVGNILIPIAGVEYMPKAFSFFYFTVGLLLLDYSLRNFYEPGYISSSTTSKNLFQLCLF
jgi:tellurite resistance protein TehA-like permease